MKNLGIAICLVLGLNTVQATNPLFNQNSHFSTSVSDFYKGKEITVSIERSAINESFNSTIDDCLKEQKKHGGVIVIKSTDTHFEITYSTRLKPAKDGVSVDYEYDKTKGYEYLYTMLKRLSNPVGSEVSMVKENMTYKLNVKKG